MDPLVKAHLRIAALEQQLREVAEPRGSFTAHVMRVIPLPGDTIRCKEMHEPMDVRQVNIYYEENPGEPAFKSYVISGAGPDNIHHTCRPSTCMFTIKIQRRGREAFERVLLRAVFRDEDSYSYGSTG